MLFADVLSVSLSPSWAEGVPKSMKKRLLGFAFWMAVLVLAFNALRMHKTSIIAATLPARVVPYTVVLDEYLLNPDGTWERTSRFTQAVRLDGSRFIETASLDPAKPTSLDGYVKRAREGQEQIYYFTGPELTAISKSPNLEIFRKRNLEVLYLTDPIDEVVLAQLGTTCRWSLVLGVGRFKPCGIQQSGLNRRGGGGVRYLSGVLDDRVVAERVRHFMR